MPTRTAKFVSTVFAGILASIPLTTFSHSETLPSDNCLSAPKGEAPAGSHWYYRIDHGTKRHCWYIRAEGERVLQTAPQSTPAPAKQAAPAEAPMQRSVANAHAELPTQTNRNDVPNTNWPGPAAESNPPRANAFDANATLAVVASRWPDPSGVSRAASPQQPPATDNSASANPPIPVASPVQADMTLIPAAAESSPQGERRLMPLLVAIMGAFTLACGLIGKFGRPRQPRPRKFRARPRPVWELTDDDRIVLYDDPSMHDLPRRRVFSQTVGDAGRRNGRVGVGLSRLSGQART